MKTWTYIEWSNEFSHGVTDNGDPYIETEINGWNDEDNYTDVAALSRLKAIILNSHERLDVGVDTEYIFEDARNNLKVRRLSKEIEGKLKKEVMNFISNY